MIKLQPYNQGEYICDAYVIIDEENATAHVRNVDHGINFDIENLNRTGGILFTLRIEMLKRGYKLGRFRHDYTLGRFRHHGYTTKGGYNVDVYERKA